jgi:hypothetical protein
MADLHAALHTAADFSGETVTPIQRPADFSM